MSKQRTARRIAVIAATVAMTLRLTALASAAPAVADAAMLTSDATTSIATNPATNAGPTASPTASPADELSALQSQIALLRAKAEIARLQAEIRTAGSAAGNPASALSTQPTQPVQVVPDLPAAAPRVVHDHGDSVRLVCVDAYNGQYGALLDIDGRSVPVREHDVIDGGWTVARITGTAVELRRGAQTRVVRL